MSLARSLSRLVCTLAVLTAITLLGGTAHAQSPALGSVILRWSNCYTDGGTSARTFACNTNSGSDQLVVSMVPPIDFIGVTEVDASLQVFSTAASTPSWWTFATGGCRGTAGMQISGVRPATSTSCSDPWSGQAFTAYDFAPTGIAPNIGRLRLLSAVSGDGVSIPAGSEVFVAALTILHSKTVGAGSCSGCATGTCIGLDYLQVWNQTSGPYTFLLAPLPNTTSDVVGWQMDASLPEQILFDGPSGFETWHKHFSSCSAAVTSERHPTWGAVKSMYR